MPRLTLPAVLLTAQFLSLSIARAQTVTPSGAVCAPEGQTCYFTGTATVFFGANDRWVARTATNGVECNNTVFGDPAPGVAKACRLLFPAPAGSPCADEGGHCSFSGDGTVYYGANDHWTALPMSNGADCSNAVFGDPAPNVAKHCSYQPPQGWGFTLRASSGGAFSSNGSVCPGHCVAFQPGSGIVEITATPDAGFAFGGWAGGPCGGQPAVCHAAMYQGALVTGHFVPAPPIVPGTGYHLRSALGLNYQSVSYYVPEPPPSFAYQARLGAPLADPLFFQASSVAIGVPVLIRTGPQTTDPFLSPGQWGMGTDLHWFPFVGGNLSEWVVMDPTGKVPNGSPLLEGQPFCLLSTSGPGGGFMTADPPADRSGWARASPARWPTRPRSGPSRAECTLGPRAANLLDVHCFV